MTVPTPLPEPSQSPNWAAQLNAAITDRYEDAKQDAAEAADMINNGRLSEESLKNTIDARVETVVTEQAAPLDTRALAAQSSIRTQLERQAKGGTVGVKGKGVIVFRWDDWQDALREHVWPLFFERALPAGHVLISRFQTAQPWGANTTWDDIRDWTKNGVEIWCHGTNHRDPTPDGNAGIYREIVTAKHEIEAQGIKVMGFAPPGTTPVGPDQPFGTLWDSPEAYDTYTGRLIQAHYGISDGYMTARYRRLPDGIYHGVVAGTVNLDSHDKATVLAMIDKCIDQQLAGKIFGHAGNNVNGTGNAMSLADLTDVLDYIVQKRDEGVLEVLTPSASFFGSHESDYRLDLFPHGTFENVTTGDARFTGWGSKTIETSGGQGDSSNFLRIPNGDSGYLNFTQDDLGKSGLGVNGEVFMLEAWLRSNSGAAVARLQVQDAVNVSLRPVISHPVTIASSEWQRVQFPISLYHNQNRINIGVRRVSGAGASLDVSNMRFYKV